MTFVPEDEDGLVDRIVRLDFADIAALLPEVTPERDAYDILRDVLTSLGEHARDSGKIAH